MRVFARAGAVVCGVAALALVAAGCSGNGSGTESEDAAIVIDGSEPQNPLIPGNTTEQGGGRVVDVIFSGLLNYQTEDAAPENEIAESIDTPDGQNYTIKLKKGWTFHNGTEIKAKNFVDAWNWNAYSPNAALNAPFFEPIEGYADVNTVDPDGDGPQKAPEPKAKEMSGLKVVDDYTFTVKLTRAFGPFKIMPGYPAFAPLPDVFFDDPKAFGEKPVGNGPFKFVSWNHNKEIVLERFDDYKGAKPKVKKVTFKMYQDLDAAYNDVRSNNLDFLMQVPPSGLAGSKYQTDFPERFTNRDIAAIETVTFPLYDARFRNADLRKAVSLAIDRKTITEAVFGGARTPATAWTSETVSGSEAGTCGEFCTFDPAKAKQHLTAAGGFTGQLKLYYNANGGHKAWTEAVANSIKQSIGIDAVAVGITEFSEFRTKITTDKMDGMFRSGWVMDYPSVENFLSPNYRTNASSNDGGYANPAFDAALNAADAIQDTAAANKAYVEAEKLLANDMPVMPLWYTKRQGVFSDKITNVKPNFKGQLDLTVVEVK